jgi:hypothetical protein
MFDDISKALGPVVSNLFDWLTEVSRPEDGNRTLRKHVELLHTAKAPPSVNTIKLTEVLKEGDHTP